jgi:tape measure domain-containing protein
MANEVQTKIALDTKQAIAALTKLSNSLDGFGDTVSKNSKKTTSAFTVMKGVIGGQAVVGAFKKLGRAASSVFGTIANEAIKLEQMEVQFQVLTKSTAKAQQHLEDLQEFAATTPFQLEGIAKSSQVLLAFGFELDDIVPKLQAIGDVAAGSGQDLKEIALIFGQVKAASKLTGERLLQLKERGIPIITQLANDLGLTEKAVEKMVTRGEIDFKKFETSFLNLSKESGLFFQGMIKQSKTMGGLISTLKDNFKFLASGIGKELLPTMKILASEMIKFLQDNKKRILDFSKSFIKGMFDAFTNTIKFLAPFENAFLLVFNSIKLGTQVVLFAVLRLAKAVLAVTADVFRFFKKDTSMLDRTIAGLENGYKSLGKSAMKSAEDVNKSWSRKSDTLQKFADKLDEIKEKTSAPAETEKVGVEPKPKVGKSKVEAAAEENQALIALEKERVDAFALMNAQQQVLNGEMDADRFALFQERLGTEEALKQESLIRMLENQGKFNEAEKKSAIAQANAMKKITMSDVKFSQLSNMEKVKAAAQTSDLLVQLSSSGGKKTFKITKALMTTQAILNGIAAVQQAYLSAPFPLSIVNAAAMAGIAAANVAKIQSQQAPAFEEGGVVQGNSFTGDNILARVNSGEQVLTISERQNFAGEVASLKEEIGKLSSQPITIELDGIEFGRAVRSLQANGVAI